MGIACLKQALFIKAINEKSMNFLERVRRGAERWRVVGAARVRTQLTAVRRVVADTSLLTAGILLAVAVGVWLAWHYAFPSFGSDYRVEFMGLIFDIFFILMIFAVLQYGAQRRQAIARQEETVEDYKRWDSVEARFRLAGALRRLNRLGVTTIDFTGVRLSDFNFSDNKIQDISGSVFYDGSWGEPFKPNEIALTKVSFDWVRCNNVQFSPFNPLQAFKSQVLGFASFADCSFRYCKLEGSSFNGAHLLWTDKPPDSLYEDGGYDDDGFPIAIRAHYGPFEDADLKGVSFRNTQFANADFRGVLNIAKADFTGAGGLDTCIFDQDALENEVLRTAAVKTGR